MAQAYSTEKKDSIIRLITGGKSRAGAWVDAYGSDCLTRRRPVVALWRTPLHPNAVHRDKPCAHRRAERKPFLLAIAFSRLHREPCWLHVRQRALSTARADRRGKKVTKGLRKTLPALPSWTESAMPDSLPKRSDALWPLDFRPEESRAQRSKTVLQGRQLVQGKSARCEKLGEKYAFGGKEHRSFPSARSGSVKAR